MRSGGVNEINSKPKVQKTNVLILSLYYSTDRILLYTDFLDNLSKYADPTIWSLSVEESSFPKENQNARYFRFLKSKDSIPHWLNLLRHFADYVWDYKNKTRSRESIWRLIKYRSANKIERALHFLAKPVAFLGMENHVSRLVQECLIRYGFCQSTLDEVETSPYSAVISMVPFSTIHQSAIAAAKKKELPIFAFITSWDNLTTKTRMSFDFDGYLVWSESMKQELWELYPTSRKRPTYVVGAVQYDIFHDKKYHLERDEFFLSQRLDQKKRTAVYCLGSPNFIKEDYGAMEFLESLDEELRDQLQVVIRPHPGFYEKDYKVLPAIREKFKSVIIQGTSHYFERVGFQPESSIREWVNTFRYCDVVINTASTVTVDAAMFNKPIINLCYDSQPGRPNAQLIREINEFWNHFAPVSNSGGVWNVDNSCELIQALKHYLKDPSIDENGRAKILRRVCGSVDGNSGLRMSQAVRRLVKS